MIRFVTILLMFGMSVSLAQDMTPNAPGVVVQGTVVIGNCMQWVDDHTIADSGVAC